MKKLVTLMLVLSSPLAHAQYRTSEVSETATTLPTEMSEAPARSALLFKVGPGFSTVTGATADAGGSVGSLTGLNVAAEVDLPVSNSVAIETGLNFIQRGFSMSFSGNESGFDFSGTAKGRISYLVVPALVKFVFGSSSRFSIFAGPYAAYRLGVSSSGSLTINGQTQDIPVSQADQDNANDDISRVDYGARAGVSGEFPLTSSLSFSVGAAYDFGLKNINSGNDASTVSVKNRSILTNVGLVVAI
jgi:hypothetical protein